MIDAAPLHPAMVDCLPRPCWLLLVFLTHFVGYLILRGYAYYRHREAARP